MKEKQSFLQSPLLSKSVNLTSVDVGVAVSRGGGSGGGVILAHNSAAEVVIRSR